MNVFLINKVLYSRKIIYNIYNMKGIAPKLLENLARNVSFVVTVVSNE